MARSKKNNNEVKAPRTRKPKEERAVSYADLATNGLIAAPSYSGVTVTEQTALGIASLWCGIRVIAEAVGSLPPVIYQDDGDGTRERTKNHPLAQVLREPNPEATRPVLWETAQAHALLYGNGFLEIVRDGAGRPVQLWNLHPSYVHPEYVGGTLVYRVNTEGRTETLTAADILHVPGLTPDGSFGYHLLSIARDTIGFGLAAQRYGCNLFRNMGRPSGVIDVPVGIKLNEDGLANLKRGVTQETSGNNVGSVVVMQQGLKFNPLSFATNEQTQYKELLTFFVYEVARLLNIPPSKLHSLEKASWGNLTELNRDFLTTTLRPWLEKWEAEIERKLLLPGERGSYYVEFDTAALLRADQLARYQAYGLALTNRFMTINEVRALENLPPLPGGDDLPEKPTAPQLPAQDDAQADEKPTDSTETPKEGNDDGEA